jgi:hypothetical protein
MFGRRCDAAAGRAGICFFLSVFCFFLSVFCFFLFVRSCTVQPRATTAGSTRTTAGASRSLVLQAGAFGKLREQKSVGAPD